MRIGVFTHYIDKYPRSAPSLYQINLIKKLVEETNLEIILIHHEKNDLPIYRLAEETLIPRMPYLRERAINKLDLDLIHFNAIPWSWWPSISKLNIPSIVTVHGTIHWDDPQLDDYSSLILRTLKKILEKRVTRNITYFIAISKHVRDVLVNKLNVPNFKIGVIYLPIDHSVFKPINPETVQKIRSKYEIKSKYILHVSTFSRRKNPVVLLKSFHAIKKFMRNIMLVIVGSGWNNSFIRKLIKEFGLQGDVKILGWVPRDDLVALYNGAEASLFPSLHENFGFPIVEAMACGCPVVTSNVYAIPETCADVAILCNPCDYKCFANAIFNILSNPQLREEMIRKSIRRAKLFSWDSHIDKVVEIYRKFITNCVNVR